MMAIKAIGPFCQGFAKPINDLSRGCIAEDKMNILAVKGSAGSKC